MEAEGPVPWLSLAVEHVDAGIVIHGPDGAVVWANERAAWLIGLARDHLTGAEPDDPVFQLLDRHGEPLEMADFPVVRVLADPDTPYRDEELASVAPDGTITWGRVSAVPVFDDGAIAWVVVTFVDITERKKVEEALAQSEGRLAAAVRGTSDGIWYQELPDGETFFSSRFEELLGLAPGTLASPEDFFALVHPEDLDPLRAHRAAYLAGRSEAYDTEVRVRHASGRWRWFRVRGRFEPDGSGRPGRLGGALQDITERKLAEAAQQALDAKLAETTRLESLALLAGGIAHDFNNILVGILSATDLALQDVGNTEARELLELSLESSSRAAELTRQLLAYAGRAQFLVEAVDVPSLLRDVCKLASGIVGGSARLDLDLAPVPRVFVDATQLKQVCLNLIINASQAVAESDGGTVWVRCGVKELQGGELAELAPNRDLRPGSYTVVTVEDDGIGMEPEVLERVFEPFFTTKAKGSGLGLAAVHGMVRSHDGFVVVHSEVGRGSRFEVGLPAHEALIGTPSQVDHSPRRPRARDRLSALVVDDEVAVRHVLAKALRAEGMEVEVTEDPDRLPERIRDNRPDVLLLDVALRGVSGLSVLKEVRETDPDLPVVVMSGHVDTSEREVVDWRNTRFLPKPFRISDLDRCLDSLGLTS